MSCGNTSANTVSNVKTENVPNGTWGGNHISMEITDAGARIEYDCAHGTIDQPIRLDSHGRFHATGTHTRERGGPVREGGTEGSPATYSGRMNGATLTLTVTLTATNEAIGTFTLTHGKRTRLMKCL
jgi:hypothetical protein